jgi:hypothetical protein
MAYVMRTKGLFGAEFGFWAFEALLTASITYVGTILDPISDHRRRATKLDPVELGIRMHDLFRNLGTVSEVLWEYVPGGVTKGMREASTLRPDNLPLLSEAPSTPFFRTFRAGNFEEEIAKFKRRLSSDSPLGSYPI